MGFFTKMITDKDFRQNELAEGRKVADEHRRAVRLEQEEKHQRQKEERTAKAARGEARRKGWGK